MEKKIFCSALMPLSLMENPEERCENCREYYRASDVDAMLAAVRALVEAAKLSVPCLEDWVRATGFGEVNRRDKEALNSIKQAIAEVEPYIKEVRHIEEKD